MSCPQRDARGPPRSPGGCEGLGQPPWELSPAPTGGGTSESRAQGSEPQPGACAVQGGRVRGERGGQEEQGLLPGFASRLCFQALQMCSWLCEGC